jgi:predicted cation transporter
MAKFEEITTFNLDDKTFAVASLSQEGKDLLKVYMQTEDDIVKHKVALVQFQHALASMGNMFRDLIKDVAPLPVEAIRAQQAAEALIAAKGAEPANNPPKRRTAGATGGPKRVR